MITVVQTDTCQWCGKHHTYVCDLVKALEYHQDGTLKRVEFHEPRTSLPPEFKISPSTDPFTWTATNGPSRWIGHPAGDHWIVHPAG